MSCPELFFFLSLSSTYVAQPQSYNVLQISPEKNDFFSSKIEFVLMIAFTWKAPHSHSTNKKQQQQLYNKL